jgi:hypothetical protein
MKEPGHGRFQSALESSVNLRPDFTPSPFRGAFTNRYAVLTALSSFLWVVTQVLQCSFRLLVNAVDIGLQLVNAVDIGLQIVSGS